MLSGAVEIHTFYSRSASYVTLHVPHDGFTMMQIEEASQLQAQQPLYHGTFCHVPLQSDCVLKVIDLVTQTELMPKPYSMHCFTYEYFCGSVLFHHISKSKALEEQREVQQKQ